MLSNYIENFRSIKIWFCIRRLVITPMILIISSHTVKKISLAFQHVFTKLSWVKFLRQFFFFFSQHILWCFKIFNYNFFSLKIIAFQLFTWKSINIFRFNNVHLKNKSFDEIEFQKRTRKKSFIYRSLTLLDLASLMVCEF